MHLLTSLLSLALLCGLSSTAQYKRNLDLLDMMKTPLLMTYREEVPENQLYYLTQLQEVPNAHYFRRNGVVPRL
ncbi:unnamed protein product [Cylicocyclus nassatus]|uniref:Uncharacterized protein n=1 Tax=Cylicocyclus nassatus TaxID=53992 RepID=A0AA36H429_CYLNA|nr:unnamed protein product [Cylicocyclus nassatus]